MQKTYRTVNDIKATVTEDWNHPNCKFKKGDFAEVTGQVIPREWVTRTGVIKEGRSYVSNVKQRRVGQVGRVVAVSCNALGKIRSNNGAASHVAERMYTRYYIQFKDGAIMGYDSHHLKAAYSFVGKIL